jgi:hypothetical protein
MKIIVKVNDIFTNGRNQTNKVGFENPIKLNDKTQIGKRFVALSRLSITFGNLPVFVFKASGIGEIEDGHSKLR